MEWNYKTKAVYTHSLKYAKRIKIASGQYCNNDGLWIGLYTMNGEYYSDITKSFNLHLGKELAYVEANSEAERFVIEQNLGINLLRPITNGFNTYNLYKFTNKELLKI